MEIGAILLIVATGIGILAGIVQVVDYVQKRVERRKEERTPSSLATLSVVEILHNLPPRSEFIGRVGEKEKIREALKSRTNIVCIDGMGGIGKTSLALEIAHEYLQASLSEKSETRDRFQGFVWISSKGSELTLDSFLTLIARVLAYPNIAASELPSKQTAIQRLLSKKPYLIIVDNFEAVHDESIKSFLVDLPEPSKAIVTTRDQFIARAWSLSLKGLSKDECFALIHQEGKRLNLKSLEVADTTTCLQVYEATGGAPLAIKWAIGQIKQKGQTLDGVLALLYNATGDIYESVFSNSWMLLSPHSRQVILALSILPASVSKPCLSAGANIHEHHLDEAIGQLVEMSFVDVTDETNLNKRRYSIHPLTRFFAVSKLREFPDLENIVLSRILLYYQSYTKEVLNSGWKGYLELLYERENLLKVIRWGYREKWNPTKDLSLAIKWPLWENGYWQEILSIYEEGFSVATKLEDFMYMGRYAIEIAWVKCRQGSMEEALAWSKKVSRYWSSVAVDNLDLADLESLNGLIEKANHNLEQSRLLLTNSLNVFIVDGHNNVEMLRIMTYLGELERDQGNIEMASEWFSRTLNEAENQDQKPAIAWSLGNLGEIEYAKKNYEQAKVLLKRGLLTAQEISRYHTIADCAFKLGRIEELAGDKNLALEYFRLAHDKYLRLGIEQKVNEVQESITSLASTKS